MIAPLARTNTDKTGREDIMRQSDNQYKIGRLINGYDYHNQAWVVDGKYVHCGHPASMNCTCYGRLHEGEKCRERED